MPAVTVKFPAAAEQVTVLPVLWVAVVLVPAQPPAPPLQVVQLALVKSWLVTSSEPITASLLMPRMTSLLLVVSVVSVSVPAAF